MRQVVAALLVIGAVLSMAQAQGPALDLCPPADALLLAVEDCAKIGKGAACTTRYLDLAPFPPAQREEAYLVLCGHMQHLSRAPDIVRPAIVPGTAGVLVRINLLDYVATEAQGKELLSTWEKLADADPYYHLHITPVTKITTQVKEYYYWPGGIQKDGKYYEAGDYYYYKDVAVSEKQEKTQSALAPWLTPTEKHKAALAVLVDLTQSQCPILRGDWFFNQSAAQQNRKPGYYDFLGVKDQKTYEKLIGFDQKLFDGFSVEVRASVADSGVSLQPRAIARLAALGGGYWKTFDFKQATNEKNPLAILGKDIEHDFDASEVFGQMSNGFWATALLNKKGEIQDVAPSFVASDGMSQSNDKQVHVNASCMRCHYEGGLKPIEDWTRNLLTPPPGLAIEGYDYDKLKMIRQQYLKKLEPLLAKDRLTFEEACKEATGWDAKTYSKKYAAWWERFEDAKVDLAWAERDLGYPKEKVKLAIQKVVSYGKGDLVAAALLKANMKIPIRQWLEVYPKVQEAIHAYK